MLLDRGDDSAAWPTVLHGVGQQVRHDLRDTVRIRPGLGQAADGAHIEGPVGRRCGKRLDGSAHERRHVHALAHELESLRVEP
jgi:hypothetical protein